MTHIVTEKCIKCKYTTCVEVCPVDCFYEGDLMLVINPNECIDCGVCVPECPIGAIEAERPESISWIEKNAYFSKIWPKITQTKPALQDASLHVDEEHKFEKYMKEPK